MVVKLSSASTIFAAPCATAVPDPIATPMSAACSAGASFTPSPVIAATSPGPPSDSRVCRHSTMTCLWIGSVREKRLAVITACSCSRLLILANSAPVRDLPRTSSPGSNTPIILQTASAVFWLSPVMTMTLIPAFLHVMIESLTSLRGGSRMPTTPTNVMLLSTLAKDLGSASLLSERSTLCENACARHRRAFVSLPYSLSTLDMIASRILSVICTMSPFAIMALLQRARTLSGAPLQRS
mmetsp:Transcript_9832/g.22456  ORF Transcript_9832/g.22456 Transcript_9832/m.22456 type:complete len:240 (-) Transcript_9832:1734-2453(-)